MKGRAGSAAGLRSGASTTDSRVKVVPAMPPCFVPSFACSQLTCSFPQCPPIHVCSAAELHWKVSGSNVEFYVTVVPYVPARCFLCACCMLQQQRKLSVPHPPCLATVTRPCFPALVLPQHFCLFISVCDAWSQHDSRFTSAAPVSPYTRPHFDFIPRCCSAGRSLSEEPPL